MAVIVGVHGVGQQFKGEDTLRSEWLPALRDGVRRAGGGLALDATFVCSFYGDLFRPAGTKALGDPPYDARDVTDPWERDLLEAWWREAATAENVAGPTEPTKGTPRAVQYALSALSRSRFFAGMAERAMIADLRQARMYLHDPSVRQQARARLRNVLAPDTRVVVAHSLGSVVAYEVLCSAPELGVRSLVTLGSPLGIRHLFFDRLEPPPEHGRGCWPGAVQRWVNVADAGDIVALVKTLAPAFGDRVQDHFVSNGAGAHDVTRYLTAQETGAAIAAGLGA